MKPVIPKPPDPEALAPLRALDYGSLLAMHQEPVKSAAHGNRWIRVWVNPVGESAYREGRSLPEGSLVVMSTTEDRWGRPGHDPGPLYALEVKPGGKPSLTFYWARVPEAAAERERGPGSGLLARRRREARRAALGCHAKGTAPLRDRSKWAIPKPKPKSEAERE